MERSGLQSDEDAILGKALKFSKTGSHEKMLLRFIAVGNLGRDAATKLICDDVDYGRTLSNADERTSSQRIESMRKSLGYEDDRKDSSNVRGMYMLGASDWAHFQHEERRSVQARRVMRGSVETVEDCVRFIYDTRFRQIMAHRVKNL